MKNTNINYSSLVSRLRNLYEEEINPVTRTNRALHQIKLGSKKGGARGHHFMDTGLKRLKGVSNPEPERETVPSKQDARAVVRRIAGRLRQPEPEPKPEPKVDDSTQPSLVSIIRKRIEEKRANLSENDSSKPKDVNYAGPTNSDDQWEDKPTKGTKGPEGRVDTGKWARNGSGRGLLPLKNKRNKWNKYHSEPERVFKR